jgi:hypothetical protein
MERMKAEWMDYLPYSEVVRLAKAVQISRGQAYDIAEEMWEDNPNQFSNKNIIPIFENNLRIFAHDSQASDTMEEEWWADGGEW